MRIRARTISVDGSSQFESPVESIVELMPGDTVAFRDEDRDDVLRLELSADGRTIDLTFKSVRRASLPTAAFSGDRRAIRLTGPLT